LPYDIRDGLNIVNLHALPDTLEDSGIEGLTFSFKWSWYAGHHLVGKPLCAVRYCAACLPACLQPGRLEQGCDCTAGPSRPLLDCC
jgi:hypothetical protein